MAYFEENGVGGLGKGNGTKSIMIDGGSMGLECRRINRLSQEAKMGFVGDCFFSFILFAPVVTAWHMYVADSGDVLSESVA